MFFKVVLQEPSPRKGREEEEEEEVTTALSDNSEPPAGAHHILELRNNYFLHSAAVGFLLVSFHSISSRARLL